MENDLSLGKALKYFDDQGHQEWLNFVIEASGVTDAITKMKVIISSAFLFLRRPWQETTNHIHNLYYIIVFQQCVQLDRGKRLVNRNCLHRMRIFKRRVNAWKSSFEEKTVSHCTSRRRT